MDLAGEEFGDDERMDSPRGFGDGQFGASDFDDDDDVAVSDDSGESEGALENREHDSVRNEFPGERDNFKRGLELLTTRPDCKYRYYHAGIFKFGDLNGPQELLTLLKKANRDIRLLYVWLDRNHLHVVHDCAYSNSSCRCFSVKPTGRKSRRRQFRELSAEEIAAIVEYYFTNGKILLAGKIRFLDHSEYHDRVLYHGSLQNPSGSFVELGQHVALSEPIAEADIRHKRSVSESSFDTMGADSTSLFSYAEEAEGASSSKRSRHSEVSRGLRTNRYVATCKKIEAKLRYICCAPIAETINSELWQEDEEFKYMQQKQGAIDAAIHSCELWFRTKKLKDLIKFIESENFAIGHPMWAANSVNSFDRMYMSVEQSYNMLILWILYQFNNFPVDENMEYRDPIDEAQWSFLAQFIKEFAMWFNGEADRRYTYCLIGQTKGGKTMFADVIMDLKINVGVMGNYNRNTSFPLNMCANKSMYYWNEPEIEPGALEEIKKIAGGDKHTVAVKHKNNRTQAQIQLLITANKYPFPRTEVFNSRCIYKCVRGAPFLLKANGKRYHPLGFIKLIRACENVLEEEL